jgi:hypothetical protein
LRPMSGDVRTRCIIAPAPMAARTPLDNFQPWDV